MRDEGTRSHPKGLVRLKPGLFHFLQTLYQGEMRLSVTIATTTTVVSTSARRSAR